MIDLHLHTTASDGRLPPARLVERCAAAGLSIIAVTDHDTTAAVDEVAALAAARGIRVVPAVEVTAVDAQQDVHVLGYFIDHRHPPLQAFLAHQRSRREARAREMAARLAALGAPVAIDRLLARQRSRAGASIARPQLARALVRAGHVSSVEEAFDRFLGHGRPAFVPRVGPSPAEVVGAIHDAGGAVSFAHPGVTRRDDLLAPLAAAGLDALEAYHSDHDAAVCDRYRTLAASLDLAVSGGSDFHGYGPTRATLGRIHLPRPAFEALEERLAARAGRPVR